MTDDFEAERARAADWFRSLRDQIVEAFEALERDHANGPLSDAVAGTFEVTPTKRSSDDGSDAGGGLKTRGSGHQASVWWRICKTPTPQRCT